MVLRSINQQRLEIYISWLRDLSAHKSNAYHIMPSISTVTGPIPTSALGVTLMHEHIICSSPVMMSEFGDKWFDREAVVELAASKVRRARSVMACRASSMPRHSNLARDIPLLAEVSRRSGVNIIAATGMLYLDDFAFWKVPPEIMAEYFVDECRTGIRDSDVRPGVLKCAVEAPQLSSTNRTYLEIIAIVQKATRLPIIAHSHSASRNGLLLLDFFSERGVDPAGSLSAIAWTAATPTTSASSWRGAAMWVAIGYTGTMRVSPSVLRSWPS
jgi:predicted metal-dependent phosphotriesterase family hydrolase